MCSVVFSNCCFNPPRWSVVPNFWALKCDACLRLKFGSLLWQLPEGSGWWWQMMGGRPGQVRWAERRGNSPGMTGLFWNFSWWVHDHSWWIHGDSYMKYSSTFLLPISETNWPQTQHPTSFQPGRGTCTLPQSLGRKRFDHPYSALRRTQGLRRSNDGYLRGPEFQILFKKNIPVIHLLFWCTRKTSLCNGFHYCFTMNKWWLITSWHDNTKERKNSLKNLGHF